MSVGQTLWQAIELIARMTWETWWALVLGFALSGVIETFVSDDRMSDLLGDDGWREVGLGAAFGAASSSCSYAAVGTSRAVFRKGASGAASLGAFLFASTDLVIELGLVIWTLLGWRFVVGEYLGGIVAVIVVALLFKRVVPQRLFDDARAHVHTVKRYQCAACGMEVEPDDDLRSLETIAGTKYFCCGGCLRAYRSQSDVEGDASLTEKLLTTDGWRTACRNGLKEWEMLWSDIAVGFLLAGVVAAFVPDAWWTVLFDSGSGLGGIVRNAVVAVAIAIATSMCSVGNVPFALVLWTNGLPFGAVLSFIYADLIIPPLVSAYNRYYGRRMAAVLFASFAVAAVVAGVVTDLLFGAVGLIPPRVAADNTLADGYTTVLNVGFTLLFGLQIVAARGAESVELSIRALPDRLRRRRSRAAAALRRADRWSYRTALRAGDAVVHLTAACRSAAAAVGRLLAGLIGLLRRAAELLR